MCYNECSMNIKQQAFTIVELLVVIAVIIILASISIVSYSGVQVKAEEARVQSDLKTAADLAERDCLRNASCTIDASNINDNQGFSPSPGITIEYTGTDDSFCVTASSDKPKVRAFYFVRKTSIKEGVCAGHSGSGGGGGEEGETPPEPPIGSGWLAVSAGTYHACGISYEHKAYCWGSNDNGRLGNDSTTSSLVPVAVYTGGALSGKTIKAISAGGLHTCAIASDNQVYCWGDNTYGQLGNNSTDPSPAPGAVYVEGVLSGKTIRAISSGQNHTCVIASDNNAYCWGYNYYGQLGNNSTGPSSAPVAVTVSGVLAGKTVKHVSAGNLHTCAIASDSNAYCWGRNTNGQLGNGSYNSSLTPVAVSTSGNLSGKTIKHISAGSGHTCAIASNNQAYCWGYNVFGELGNSSTTSSSAPVAVSTSGDLSGKTIKIISSGQNHTCAVASDNNAYCWGANVYGQLGNSSTTNSSVPVAVSTSGDLSGKTVKSIAIGSGPVVMNPQMYPLFSGYTCATASDNNIYCWGRNNRGQLGNNTTANSSTPVKTNSP